MPCNNRQRTQQPRNTPRACLNLGQTILYRAWTRAWLSIRHRGSLLLRCAVARQLGEARRSCCGILATPLAFSQTQSTRTQSTQKGAVARRRDLTSVLEGALVCFVTRFYYVAQAGPMSSFPLLLSGFNYGQVSAPAGSIQSFSEERELESDSPTPHV